MKCLIFGCVSISSTYPVKKVCQSVSLSVTFVVHISTLLLFLIHYRTYVDHGTPYMFSNFRDFEPIHIYIILTIYLTNIYSAGRFEAFMPVCMDFDADADANADADAPRVSDIRKLHTLERTIVPRTIIFGLEILLRAILLLQNSNFWGLYLHVS